MAAKLDLPIVFPDNSTLKFGRGKFDNWCIYYFDAQLNKIKFPLDSDYFQELIDLAKLFGYQKLYDDFIKIYDLTTKDLTQDVYDLIINLALQYNLALIQVEILLSIIWFGMVAEENKQGTVLGKRIKRLGVHMILVDKWPALYAANVTRGMEARFIAVMCKERGF